MKEYAASHELAFFPEMPETASPYVKEAPDAAWLAGVLQALRAPDAARDYLLVHGASEATLERFRARMVE